jgi:hypothetical protein
MRKVPRSSSPDWSQPALLRTWRTLSVLCASAGIGSAVMHWPVPAALLCLLALWTHAKRQAIEG